MTVCGACATDNPERAKFCLECGAPLGAVAAPAREERKVITCLFCDLVGFTSQAERLDPEEVRAVLQPYHARLREVLERHGGTVEKFIGDAVMAVFGAPTAHEDDPERAVRAALAIRDAIAEGGELHVRIGITTGEALVSLGARPEAGEGIAAGDVVNTAARLQSAAPVDGILVDETTCRATERAIEYRPHEPVLAKGKAEPVPVREAVQPRARFGVDVRHHGGAALVGRARERDALAGAFERAVAERSPQLVTLVGVPGIGKSRLVYELFQWADARPELVTWRQGRSLPYGDGVSLWALGEIVKAEAGVLETDDAAEAGRKLEAAVTAAVPEEGEREWVTGHLRPLLGLAAGDARGDRRSEAFAAWRRFLEGVAERGPAVLVFEDLHWADDALLDFVDHLVDWATGVPVLVLATARPELLARRPGWGGGKPNAATISLSALSDDETARLVHALVERSVLPAELQATLIERAGGNPLYAEEFARLLAAGREPGELPESVQGIVAARLDGLPEPEKELLRTAAVIGKVFWVGALAAMTGTGRAEVEELLHALDRKEFVRRERSSSVAAETEHVFRHALVREVAYGQIPRGERVDKHRRAAAWLETLPADRAEDRAEMVAHHHVAALGFARAAGAATDELAATARLALRDAGDRALALQAFPAAARFYESALDLAAVEEAGRWKLLLGLGRALHVTAGDRAAGTLREAAAAALAAGEPLAAAEAEAFLSHVLWHSGARGESLGALERAVELAADGPPSPAKALVLARQTSALMLSGESRRSLEVGSEALRIADQLGLDDVRANVLASVGGARVALGDPEGFGDLERAVEIARSANLPEEARALNNLASVTSIAGDVAAASALYERALVVATRFGDKGHARFLRGNMIWSASVRGDWETAAGEADAFLAECEAGSPHYLEHSVRMCRAFLRFHRDDEAGALADLRRAVAAAREANDPQALIAALGQGALIAADAGRSDEAGALFDELIAELGPLERPIAAATAAWAALALGRVEELRPFLEEEPSLSRWRDAARAVLARDFGRAAELYAGIGSVADEARARVHDAERLLAEGRRAEAEAQLERALAFFRSAGASRYLRDAEALAAAG